MPAVPEAGFARHHVQRVAALFDHQPRRLQPQAFNRLGRRLPGLRRKDPAELARAQVHRLREFLHRQRLAQVLARVVDGALDAV
ncbi:hypothetical protein D3C86_1646710 [compost metagenome]